ncbi:MAG: response regulator transcription factor [Bacteroidota bacterium]
MKVAIRSIGHEFLLQLEDSTSRILAIENTEGRYALRFENDFSFDPSYLSFAVFKVLEKKPLLENLVVEVEKCGDPEVVYSFEATFEQNDDVIPCGGRIMPNDCYVVYFSGASGGILAEQAALKSENTYNYLFLLLFLIGGGGYFAYRKNQKQSKKDEKNLIAIGAYFFDRKRMQLRYKNETIKLSSKEADLLYLLCSNENKTLEREFILSEIWNDTGAYIGRTLDVFISKLRKKLLSDPSLKIVNVRGVGYRFVIH